MFVWGHASAYIAHMGLYTRHPRHQQLHEVLSGQT